MVWIVLAVIAGVAGAALLLIWGVPRLVAWLLNDGG
jgi:hypothetical protein